jgi:hypothetical protein
MPGELSGIAASHARSHFSVSDEPPKGEEPPFLRRVGSSMAKNADNDHKNDDLRAWLVIGLIIGAVTLVLYLPLLWRLVHSA